VRRLTLGIAASAVVHATLVLVWTAPDDHTASAAVEPPHVALIDVELPPPPPSTPIPAPLPPAPVPARVRPQPIVRTVATTPAVVVDTPAPAPRSSLLGMRQSKLDLRLPAMALDLPRAVDAPTGDLGGDTQRRIGERPGAATSTETPDDNFSIQVDDNGTAHVTRKSDTTGHVTVPTIADIGQGIVDWWSVEKFTDQDYMTLSGEKITEKHGVHLIKTPPNGPDDGGDLVFLIPVAGGNFDLSHLVMRAHGDDPYAAHKQAMLDASREQRAADLVAQRRVRLDAAAPTMTANLARMWAATPDLAARKQALFEMWDECAETGDAAAIRAGAEARAAVIRFIHDHTVVFAPSEIEDLNHHRHSSTAFDPR
jgi:hypothetical protein